MHVRVIWHCLRRARGRSVREAHKSVDKLPCLSFPADKARSTALEQPQQQQQQQQQQQLDQGKHAPADGPEGVDITVWLQMAASAHKSHVLPVPVLVTAQRDSI